MGPTDYIEFDNPVVGKEASDTLLGRKLGEGVYRIVFEHAWLPDYVVKFEKHQREFKNVEENELWNASHGTPANIWLAPCVYLSPRGVFLVQERTYPVKKEELPSSIPAWMTDTKTSNWGRLLNGRIVCHDYSNHLLDNALRNKRLKKVVWSDYERTNE